MNNRILNLLAIVTITTVIALVVDPTYRGGSFPTHSPLKSAELKRNPPKITLKDGCVYTYEGHDRWKWQYNCKDK